MKIDRYSGFVFEGIGNITDHLRCKKVIGFKFPSQDNDKAEECLDACLSILNEENGDAV